MMNMTGRMMNLKGESLDSFYPISEPNRFLPTIVMMIFAIKVPMD